MKYRAFGLCLQSEFVIPPLQPCPEETEPEVIVTRGNLSGWDDKLKENGQYYADDGVICMEIEGAGRFLVRGGDEIVCDCPESASAELISVYLLGSCMGAVLHRRGLMPLHGSCVCREGKAILITGESGAGKSTLASEFVRNGWKLLTDDVSVIRNIEGKPTVVSSYPSQKLWQDSLSRYAREEQEVRSLFQEERREKFGVGAADYFIDTEAPLSLIVILSKTEKDAAVFAADGFGKVNQLLHHTYRSYMIKEADRQRHFQRCVTLAGKVPMALAFRSGDWASAGYLYENLRKLVEKE